MHIIDITYRIRQKYNLKIPEVISSNSFPFAKIFVNKKIIFINNIFINNNVGNLSYLILNFVKLLITY